MRFELGPGMKCDLEIVVERRMLIQASSGGGKSRTIRRIAEQTHGKIPQIIIDPEGELVSLREKYDYVHVAAIGGDAQAHPRTARLLAERLLELGVSAILDLYELKRGPQVEFVKVFCEALMEIPKRLWSPRLIIMDEAQLFAPEGAKAESLAAVIDLATRGRKRGHALIAATQRIGMFDKNVAGVLHNKLIGFTSLDTDLKRAAFELGFDKEKMLGLRELEDMHFWGFGPALTRAPTLFQVGPHVTTHPKHGQKLAIAVPPPTEKIRALLPQLADLPAEAEQKQRTEAELKQENATLRRQLTLAQRAPLHVEPKVETKVERVAVPMLTEQHLVDLKGAASLIQQTFASVRDLVEQLKTLVPPLADHRIALTDALGSIDRAIAQATKPVQTAAKPPAKPAATPTAWRRTAPSGRLAPPAVDGEFRPSRPQQALLDALAWLETMNVAPARREQMALVARVSSASSGFEKNVSTLRTAGLIGYPSANMVDLTGAGRALANVPDQPPTTHELHEALYARVSRPQAALLRALIEAYPESLTREELGQRADPPQSPLSSGFEKNVSTLRSLGLVDYPDRGHVQALAVLFLEGAA